MSASHSELNKGAAHLADHMARSRELLARSRALCDQAGRIVEDGELSRHIAYTETSRRKG